MIFNNCYEFFICGPRWKKVALRLSWAIHEGKLFTTLFLIIYVCLRIKFIHSFVLVAVAAMQLVDGFFEDESFLMQLPEHVLSDFSLFRRRRSSEMVEIDAKPLVNGSMDGVVFVANLLRRQS